MWAPIILLRNFVSSRAQLTWFYAACVFVRQDDDWDAMGGATDAQDGAPGPVCHESLFAHLLFFAVLHTPDARDPCVDASRFEPDPSTHPPFVMLTSF